MLEVEVLHALIRKRVRPGKVTITPSPFYLDEAIASSVVDFRLSSWRKGEKNMFEILIGLGLALYDREIDMAWSLFRNGWTPEEIGMRIREVRAEEKERKKREALTKAKERYNKKR